MVFSSPVFLFAYLPLTLAVYYLMPLRWRNLALFLLSLVFYGWDKPIYIPVMLFSVTVSYLCGFPIGKYRDRDRHRARVWLVVSLVLNLSVLVFFKYTNFIIENLRLIPPLAGVLHPLEWLELPIGISFYTFQIMSYSIDLYRGENETQRSYIAFGTYVALFPQLIAGPIVRYRDVDRQLLSRTHTVDRFASGVRRFAVGFGKKILLGDALAAVYAYLSTAADFEFTVLSGWLMVATYTLHIYFDFSGYSDMAIGLGRMFGFEFPENFRYPYMASSITDFWRRWHITLSTWFREYLYIPLGGNRVSPVRKVVNLLIVSLAHHAVHLVPGVRVHPARRQPPRTGTSVLQPCRCMAADGTVARGFVEFCPVGLVLSDPARRGEGVPAPPAGAEPPDARAGAYRGTSAGGHRLDDL